MANTLETDRSMAADSDDELEESPLKAKEQRSRMALKRAAEARMNRKRSLSEQLPQPMADESAAASPPSGGNSGMLSYLNPFSYMRQGNNEPHEKNSDEG